MSDEAGVGSTLPRQTSRRNHAVKHVGILLVLLLALAGPRSAQACCVGSFSWEWGWFWDWWFIPVIVINVPAIDPATLNIDFAALAQAADEARLLELEAAERALGGQVDQIASEVATAASWASAIGLETCTSTVINLGSLGGSATIELCPRREFERLLERAVRVLEDLAANRAEQNEVRTRLGIAPIIDLGNIPRIGDTHPCPEPGQPSRASVIAGTLGRLPPVIGAHPYGRALILVATVSSVIYATSQDCEQTDTDVDVDIPTPEIPVLVISKSLMKHIAVNIAYGFEQHGNKLTRTADLAHQNRNRALAQAGHPRPPAGWSLDEYPFASTFEGGKGARIAVVPIREQSIQGGVIGQFYKKKQVPHRGPFFVMIGP